MAIDFLLAELSSNELDLEAMHSWIIGMDKIVNIRQLCRIKTSFE
jgi:hypothetical protein